MSQPGHDLSIPFRISPYRPLLVLGAMLLAAFAVQALPDPARAGSCVNDEGGVLVFLSLIHI